MKYINKKIAVFITLVFLLGLMLTACSGGKIAIDENGLASWKPVRGATQYSYEICDSEYVTLGALLTTETSVQLPEGFCVHVTPILDNGKRGTTMISDYYGEPKTYSELDVDEYTDVYIDSTIPENEDTDKDLLRIDPDFTLSWDDVSTWNIIENIRKDTVVTGEDGTISFTADGPNGNPIRFVGTGIELGEGCLTFEPGGMLTSLDSIGRICYVQHVVLENPDPENNAYDCSGGYTFNDNVSVESIDSLYFCRASGRHVVSSEPMPTMWTQPNMVHWGASSYNSCAFTLSEFTVGYDETTYSTPIKQIYMDTYLGYAKIYFEGQKYDPRQEVFDLDEQQFYFNMVIQPDVQDIAPETDIEECLGRGNYARSAIDGIETDCGKITIGNLLDADGIPVDKNNTIVTEDHRLEVDIAGNTYLLALPMAKQAAEDVKTLYDLGSIPIPEAIGEINALVIPIMWQDQPENATDAELNYFRKMLGRVADMDGTSKEYANDEFAFSKYFDLASYGNLKITSFMTDWYQAPHDFSAMKETFINDANDTIPEEVEQWLYATYKDMDWSQFDKDGDGNFDSVILLNAGRDDDFSYYQTSYEGGLYFSGTFNAEDVGTAKKPKINGFISVNIARIEEGGSVIVHEFGHNLGLIDYYDVTYSGINAVGTYDMQSDNMGDWNAFSKYCVGWLNPTVVDDLASGESIDISIGSMTITGDAIVIPAAGETHQGPLNEYMLIDLFTDDGLYESSAGMYNLSNTAGVRIYHVNASMMDVGKIINAFGSEGESFISQAFVNAYNTTGEYHLELLQKGGKNTFTKPDSRMTISKQDLFYSGDTFDAANYSEFLNDGLMDSGKEFGYTIKVMNIQKDENGEYTANIRITRK